MTLDIFLIIMTYFLKASQYELVDYMKKKKIVKKIESRITRASLKVLKCAD